MARMGKVNIEDHKVGDTLWFVGWGRADVEGTGDFYPVEDGYIYSGVIEKIELSNFQRGYAGTPDLKTYVVDLEGVDTRTIAFRVGDDGSYNPQAFATKEEAEALVREAYEETLEEAEKELEKMLDAVEHIRTRTKEPILATTAAVIYNADYTKNMEDVIAAVKGAPPEEE